MRDDTKEIAELMDKAVDLVKQHQYKTAQELLGKIVVLLTQWVERHLSP